MTITFSAESNPLRAAAAAAALLALGAAAACGTGQPAAPSGAESPFAGVVEEHLTSPMAVVNGRTIYEGTYTEILEALRARIAPGDPESVEKFLGAKQQALEKAIDEELLYEEAQRRGRAPEESEVARIWAEAVGRAGSEETFITEGGTRPRSKSEAIDSIRRTLAIDRFMKAEVEDRLTASEDEVRAYYDARPDLFTPDPWIRLGHIFVAAPPEMAAALRSEALSRISVAIEGLKKGRSFESLARDIGEDQTAPDGGMLGLFRKGNLPQAVDRVAFDLRPGEVSGIVESDEGYHILKVYERIGGRLEPFEKVAEEARKKLLVKKRADRLSAILRELRAKASIEYLDD